jgi:hypothetical protein
MATYNELPQLRQFDATIQQWIDLLSNYTLEQLCRPPRAGSWSLGQVYIHIIDDTGWFAGQMKEALHSRVDGDKTMHPDARAMFDRNGFPDVLIEGPATNTYIPQPRSKEELAQQLRAIKTEVDGLFRDFDPAVSTGKTRHPGLHFFSPLEWLQFSELHMRHHLRQKKRIDEALFS